MSDLNNFLENELQDYEFRKIYTGCSKEYDNFRKELSKNIQNKPSIIQLEESNKNK